MSALAQRQQAGPEVAGYRLERLLGRGRHCSVYLAADTRRSRQVALKLARAGGAAPGCDLAREFTAMRAAQHSHVAAAFEHGRCGGQAFLAMEYVAGGTLAQRRAALGAADVFRLMRQAAGALAALHRQGWVHRDVKPANLLLRRDGSLALGDFGCACRSGEGARPGEGVVTGTPRYAAPEQSEGAPARAAADVYALGACLYEILSGAPLVPGETLTEVFSQHLLAPVPKLAAGEAAWQPLLEALLAKDPGQRPADGQAVLWRLQREERFLMLSRGSKGPS